MRLLCYLRECLTSATGALSCAVGLTGTPSFPGRQAGGSAKQSRATEQARSAQRAPRSQARSHPAKATSTIRCRKLELVAYKTRVARAPQQQVLRPWLCHHLTMLLGWKQHRLLRHRQLHRQAAARPAQAAVRSCARLEAVCLPGEGRRCWAWIASQPTTSATHVKTSAVLTSLGITAGQVGKTGG
jgi:hypothetical protein